MRFNFEQVVVDTGSSDVEEVGHGRDAIAAVVIQNLTQLVLFLPILQVHKNPNDNPSQLPPTMH